MVCGTVLGARESKRNFDKYIESFEVCKRYKGDGKYCASVCINPNYTHLHIKLPGPYSSISTIHHSISVDIEKLLFWPLLFQGLYYVPLYINQ
jgi:hypothetical protein